MTDEALNAGTPLRLPCVTLGSTFHCPATPTPPHALIRLTCSTGSGVNLGKPGRRLLHLGL